VLPVTNLSERDLDGVLAVVAEAAAAEGQTPFERPLIDRLMELVPADKAGYYEYEGVAPGVRCRPRHIFQIESTGVWGDDVVQQWTDHVAEYLPHWPLHDNRLRGSRTAVKFSDFFDERAKRRNPWYAEVMCAGSQEHECKLLLPDRDLTIGGFFFIREPGRKDFDERDRAVLTVLRTQLAAIRDRWERRHRPSGLTAREAEIAHLLREGLTNQEIAERLVISTGTVRTHLESIFAKLGVHTRTAAVARAFGQARHE
jgi:DNA-binding CsgD family transcriptional regulator